MISVEAHSLGARKRPVGQSHLSVAGAVAVYAFLVIAAVATLLPFMLSVNTALKTPQQLATENPVTLASPLTLENFASLFSGDTVNFSQSILVTTAYVLVVLVLQLLCSILAAYVLARFRFPGREWIFWMYVGTLMVPPIVTVVPLYLMLASLGLRSTFWGLILPYTLGSPYAIFLLRQYFKAIPDELLDAAKIDGAGHWRMLGSVVLPLSRPILITLSVITVVTHWNSFLWPLIINSNVSLNVLTVMTATLQNQYNGNWTLVMAATTIAIMPLVALYLLLNRYVVNAIAITGFR